MIKTHAEYQNALERLAKDQEVLLAEESSYRSANLTEEEVQHALEPHRCFHEQLREEVAWYESVMRREPCQINSLEDLGKLVIAARIMSGLSQRKFAELIGVDESLVSRDEKNEYYGTSIRRLAEILKKLGAHYYFRMDPIERREDPVMPGNIAVPA